MSDVDLRQAACIPLLSRGARPCCLPCEALCSCLVQEVRQEKTGVEQQIEQLASQAACKAAAQLTPVAQAQKAMLIYPNKLARQAGLPPSLMLFSPHVLLSPPNLGSWACPRAGYACGYACALLLYGAALCLLLCPDSHARLAVSCSVSGNGP